MIRVLVDVALKDDVMDPQGKAVGEALASLGHATVRRVRVGRFFDLMIEGDDPEEARAAAKGMCEALLANTVIERFDIRVEPAAEAR